MTDGAPVTLHASAVELSGRGVLISGASGSGKSILALGLLARGGRLISDDRTRMARRRERLLAWAPRPILGRIEARGIGLLAAEPAPPTPVDIVVDLDQAEPDRLPPPRSRTLLGLELPLLLGHGHPALADALIQVMRCPHRITA